MAKIYLNKVDKKIYIVTPNFKCLYFLTSYFCGYVTESCIETDNLGNKKLSKEWFEYYDEISVTKLTKKLFNLEDFR